MHHVRTTASEQHGRDLPAERSVWNVDIIGPAIVLGSRQTEAELDLDACAEAGIEIVRRRSGGGMVYLVPGNHIWLDVVIPKADTLWNDDVGRASWWLGDAWLAAIESLGVTGAHVHREQMTTGEHGDLVCFAGVGPGEVMFHGATGVEAKVVGISQRRTQELARFQCTMYLQWSSVVADDLGRMLGKTHLARPGLGSVIEQCVMPMSQMSQMSQMAETVTTSDLVTAMLAQLALLP